MNDTGKTPVMVGFLAGGMMVHVTQAWFSYQLPLLNADQDCPFAFMPWYEAATKPCERARNQICGAFLESECQILMMVDDDMVIGDNLIDLLATAEDWDIIAPLQHMFIPADKRAGREVAECLPCAFGRDADAPIGKQMLRVKPNGRPVDDVSAVGSGVIAIRRRVLEDPRMQVEPGYDPPAFFRNLLLPNGVRERGLDIDFCWRATELGYGVKVNWNVPVGHYKRVDLFDVDMYAQVSFMRGFAKGAEDGDKN